MRLLPSDPNLQEARMKLHANAKTCPASRLLLCRRVIEKGGAVAQAAEAAGVSARTAYRWLARYRAGGRAALQDRSSRPRRSPRRTAPERERAVLGLRRTGMTAEEIAAALNLAPRTCSRILTRHGLGRLGALEAPEPAGRYERQRPGELLHVDVKKLGRIAGVGHRISGTHAGRIRRRPGWEFVHVAVDDATRLAYAEVLADERQETCCAFLRRAVAWFAARQVAVQRVLSDNAPGYRSRAWRATCRQLDIQPKRTRVYRPRTNGKAERFIQTLTRRWAHGQSYGSSAERTQALASWLRTYNHFRPHRSLNRQTPAQRLEALRVTNVVAAHT
jgi:transposase InsO family protein